MKRVHNASPGIMRQVRMDGERVVYKHTKRTIMCAERKASRKPSVCVVTKVAA